MQKVRCQICGRSFVKVYAHLATHSISASDYRALYPGAEVSVYRHSDETLSRMRGPREVMKGVLRTEAHRKALSASRKGRKFKPHSPETIAKMKLAWIRRKEDKVAFAAYAKSVSDKLIATRGLADGSIKARTRDTTLEKKMEQYLTEHGLQYVKQKIITVPETYFLYDFFIAGLNLYIEVDGEYWHRTSEKRYYKDLYKERVVRAMGARLIRISSDDWRPSMIFADDRSIVMHNQQLMDRRAVHLGISA